MCIHACAPSLSDNYCASPLLPSTSLQVKIPRQSGEDGSVCYLLLLGVQVSLSIRRENTCWAVAAVSRKRIVTRTAIWRNFGLRNFPAVFIPRSMLAFHLVTCRGDVKRPASITPPVCGPAGEELTIVG